MPHQNVNRRLWAVTDRSAASLVSPVPSRRTFLEPNPR
jgi:hypothetical protein